MKPRPLILATALTCAALHANAQLIVNDPLTLAQAVKQVTAWQQQYVQMKAQIDAMTGNRGMATLLPRLTPALPADWAQSMTSLTSLAQQIRQSQAVLTPAQAAYLTADMQRFVAQAQNLSAANQAMAQTAYNDAAARQSRLQTLTATLATTKDPKAAYDLANLIAIEHAALQRDQNQLEAAASGAAAQERAQRQMKNEMRAAMAGTVIPKIDTSLP
jgi:type IV secretion system protein VirB5